MYMYICIHMYTVHMTKPLYLNIGVYGVFLNLPLAEKSPSAILDSQMRTD